MLQVKIGAAVKRESVNGQKAIVVTVNKQPQADTPTVTRAVEAAMAVKKAGLSRDIECCYDISSRRPLKPASIIVRLS